MADLRHLLAIYVHAHQTGNSVPPHIDTEARAARAAQPAATTTPPADEQDRSQLSDGYHTFAELYEHRHSLMLAFMASRPDLCWFSKRHADGQLPFGSEDWFIVGANLPTGLITYHLPIELFSAARKTGADELPVGMEWDGHTANDVAKRLREWVEAPAPAPADHVPDAGNMVAADGEREELAQWLEDEAVYYEGLSTEASAKATRAAALLREARPQPVPVAERPWERPGWCDAEGRCWFGAPIAGAADAGWILRKPSERLSHQTVSLPHWAIPQPPQGGEVES